MNSWGMLKLGQLLLNLSEISSSLYLAWIQVIKYVIYATEPHTGCFGILKNSDVSWLMSLNANGSATLVTVAVPETCCLISPLNSK